MAVDYFCAQSKFLIRLHPGAFDKISTPLMLILVPFLIVSVLAYVARVVFASNMIVDRYLTDPETTLESIDHLIEGIRFR